MRGNCNIIQRLLEFNEDTYRHSVRVGVICNIIAYRHGLDAYILYLAGLYHDIGKLFLNKSIIQGSHPLTHDEREIVKTHPRKGFEFLRSQGYTDDVACAAIGHHQWCTNPYPRIEARDKTSGKAVISQIVASCDLVDALMSKRPYKPAMSIYEASNAAYKVYSGEEKFLADALQAYQQAYMQRVQ